jgi:nucleoside-diphosphate-sugar epimerase
MIYGQGSGIFNRDTRQVTELIKLASREGQLSIVGDGSGVKCHIHVQDIASFFSTLLISLLRGKSVPYSDEGVFFIENGTHTWKEVGEGVAKAGHDLSLVNTSEVKCMTLEEASTKLNMSNKEWTESAYVSR